MSFTYFGYIAIGCFLMALVSFELNKWAKWKLEQPRFYRNDAGGKAALCSIIDFDKAIPGVNPIVGEKVMIPETLSLESHNYWRIAFVASAPKEDLFVPFVSNGLISIERQKKFFMAQSEDGGEEFMRRKTQEVFAADRMLRFAQWWMRWDGLSLWALFIFGVGASFLAMLMMVANVSRNATFLATDGTGVKEYPVNGSGTIVNGGRALYRGEVIGVQPIARGTSIVCMRSARNAMWCTPSSLPHQAGEEVYFRLVGVMMNETGAEGKREARDLAVILNKPEMDALMATGKFAILE